MAVLSGSIDGFVLGLGGGGGSILAVPLLVYVVGVQSPHVAIGTSSVAVALSALASLAGHAREEHVKWRCAIVFACAGVIGALLRSSLGKMFDGQKLLLLFGVLMIVIAALMFWKRSAGGEASVRLKGHRHLVSWPISFSTELASASCQAFSALAAGSSWYQG